MFSHPAWLLNHFILRFTKVTDIVELRKLSGNEYVHVQIHVLFSDWKTPFLDLLMIGKTNVMQKTDIPKDLRSRMCLSYQTIEG